MIKAKGAATPPFSPCGGFLGLSAGVNLQNPPQNPPNFIDVFQLLSHTKWKSGFLGEHGYSVTSAGVKALGMSSVERRRTGRVSISQ